jgi:putative tryptophan/tyrosine transport system substrate-binding protein
MRRREFIAGLAGAAAWPLAARAQQGERVRRVGFLSPTDENNDDVIGLIASLVQGLEELGWVNGRNLRVDGEMLTGCELLHGSYPTCGRT